MNAAIELIGFSLRSDGRGVSSSLNSGQIIAVCGRAGSGKSHLLNALVGNAQPVLGRIRLFGSACFASDSGLPKRSTPQSIAKRNGGKDAPDRMTVVLTLLGLWDVKETVLEELSASQRHAAGLIPVLLSDEESVLADGSLDVLDPVTRESVYRYIRERAAKGYTWIVATHDLSLARRADSLILMAAGNVVFCGSVDAFMTEREPLQIDVQTSNVPSVRALVEPFAIDLEERANGLRFRARKGQSLAARLLALGYGDVRIVSVQQPRFEDLVLETI